MLILKKESTIIIFANTQCCKKCKMIFNKYLDKNSTNIVILILRYNYFKFSIYNLVIYQIF